MTKENNPTFEYSHFSQLLTVPEIAVILKISRSMAYLLVQRGELPSVRIGHSVRVQPDDLQRYIENNTTNKFGELISV